MGPAWDLHTHSFPLDDEIRASARKPRAIFGNLGQGHPAPPRTGLFLRLVQLSLYLAVTLVGRADALPIELKALVD